MSSFTSFVLLCLLTLVQAKHTGVTGLVANVTLAGREDGEGSATVVTTDAKTKQNSRRTNRYRRPIVFYTHADTNYASVERELFPIQVDNVPREAEFIIHLGDMKGVDSCRSEGPYALVSDTYTSYAKAPVFLVPGDNDWYDCGGRSDRERGFAIWESHFLYLYQKFGRFSSVQHQDRRKENFAFFRRRVLFIGVHMVGGDIKNKDEWNDLLRDSLKWTRDMVEQYGNRPKVVVIFGEMQS